MPSCILFTCQASVDCGFEYEELRPLAPAELVLCLDLSLVGRVWQEVVDVVGVVLLVAEVVIRLPGKDHVVPREGHAGLVTAVLVLASAAFAFGLGLLERRKSGTNLHFFIIGKEERYPTDPFTILEAWNLTIDESDLGTLNFSRILWL